MSRRQIVFHHIPKTGGTSVRVALIGALGIENMARIVFGPNEDGREAIARRPQMLELDSHFAFHPMVFRPTKGEFYMTWMRDPVKMVASAYHWYSRKPNGIHPEYRPRWVKHMVDRIRLYSTLEEYVDAVLVSREPFFPERLYDFDLEVFDFVGICERMTADLFRLGTELKLFLNPELHENKNIPDPRAYEYRAEDLEKRLAKELDQYEKAREL